MNFNAKDTYFHWRTTLPYPRICLSIARAPDSDASNGSKLKLAERRNFTVVPTVLD